MTTDSNRTRFVLACVAAALLAATPALADYAAYAVTEKGEFPLPETLDDIPSKHLINVKWGEYGGPKTRVAVLEVDNNSGSASYRWTGPEGQTYSYSADYARQVPVNGIEAMITDVLQRSGRFRMVERQVLGDALYEQDLVTEGRIAKPSGAKTGNVLGAEILVQAVVTSYEPNFKGKKGGLGGIGRRVLGGAKVGRDKSMVGMNFRLIDAETSEILFTKQVDVVTTSTSFGFGGAGWGSAGVLGGFLSGYSKTPIGQAVMSAVNIGAFELVKQIGTAPAQGSVVKTENGQVWINLGADAVAVGEVLEAIAKGEELIDPDTGISLGGEEESIGTLKVVEVKDKYCVAEALSADVAALERGDKIVSTREGPPLQFAPSWQGPGGK